MIQVREWWDGTWLSEAWSPVVTLTVTSSPGWGTFYVICRCGQVFFAQGDQVPTMRAAYRYHVTSEVCP